MTTLPTLLARLEHELTQARRHISYSRPGDLVVDPCSGAFTTGKAAVHLGRRFIGGDALLEHAEIGARWCAKPKQRALFA